MKFQKTAEIRTVAQTIFSQLGGNQFARLTGAKSFVSGEDYLSFAIPAANKGLPKRVILNGWDGFHGYAFNKFRDMVNAMAALRGQVPFEYGERTAIDLAHRQGALDAMFKR